MWGIHRWPVNSPHKGPVTRKMFPFDDVIMFMEQGFFNSLWPGNATWRHRSMPLLFRLIACRPFGAKPLHEPMMTYCQFSEIGIKKCSNQHLKRKIWKVVGKKVVILFNSERVDAHSQYLNLYRHQSQTVFIFVFTRLVIHMVYLIMTSLWMKISPVWGKVFNDIENTHSVVSGVM